MNLVLFFSRGTSLSVWHDSGLLDRELAPYRKMLSHVDDISFLTYDKALDRSFLKELGEIEVLNNRHYLPEDLFALMAPFLHRKKLSHASLFKTNQINGWWTAGFAKAIFKKPLIVRCGYLLSLDQERKGYGKLRNHFVSFLEKR